MLPPLNALRAFEAAARHLSFTRGADELHVTQSAISHQVRALEEHLGLRLFRRTPRRLLLTDEGQTFARELRDVFGRLREACDRVVARDARQVLTVSVLPSFAARWLVPRLPRFQARHPGIDVRVAPSPQAVNFEREGIDCGIRFGGGNYPGLRTLRLLGDEIFPVCAPSLARRLRRPADLRRQQLLHDDDYADWREWLRLAGAPSVPAARGPIFTDSSLTLQAAVDGQGVALGRRALAQDDLAAGRLARPFPLSLPVARAYYLVAPEATAELPKVRAFRAWIVEEAG